MPVDSLRHDLGALEDSATRAGLALACCYSSAAEYEAEIIRERRAAGAFANPRVRQMRLALGVTALVSLAALLVIFS